MRDAPSQTAHPGSMLGLRLHSATLIAAVGTRWRIRMSTSRREFLSAAVTLAGASATPVVAQGETHPISDVHDHSDVPSDIALRVKSLESLLVEKRVVDPVALDALVDALENKVGPRNGAKVVARANDEVRAGTRRSGTLASRSMISSVIPSAKYS